MGSDEIAAVGMAGSEENTAVGTAGSNEMHAKGTAGSDETTGEGTAVSNETSAVGITGRDRITAEGMMGSKLIMAILVAEPPITLLPLGSRLFAINWYMTLFHSKEQGQVYFICEHLVNGDTEQTLLLPIHTKSPIGF